MARGHTVQAISTLADIMKDAESPPAARVKCAEVLLDRAWGKSESTVNVRTPNDVKELSTREILAALAAHGVVGAEEGGGEPGSVH